jgi:hypothetical protein
MMNAVATRRVRHGIQPHHDELMAQHRDYLKALLQVLKAETIEVVDAVSFEHPCARLS